MRTSASSTGNETLDADIARLRKLGSEVEVLVEDLRVGVVVKQVPIASGYSLERTDVLLQTDLQYPQSGMDMLWVDPEFALEGGAHPAGGESFEVHFGRTWRRLSWHRNVPWVPGRDDLLGHFEFARARLNRAA